MASSFTQAQLTALEAAISQGVKVVRYASPDGGTKEVEYQSLKEMMDARSLMRRELGLSSQEQKVFPTFSKGF